MKVGGFPVKMDNSRYKLTFDLDNKNEILGKNLSKVVKIQNLVENVVCVENIALQSSPNALYIFVYYVRKLFTIFEPKDRNTIMRKFANFVRLYFQYITTFFGEIWEFYHF